MLKKIFVLLLSLSLFINVRAQKIQSPDEFLGYSLGSQFTHHSRIAEYFDYIAKTATNVKLVPYGTTNEGRPLMAMFIASADNIGRLEEIRQNNMGLAGIEKSAGSINTNTPVIVWLSFNVHGNEPSSSEVSMQTLYDLVDPANTRTKAWLKNTVVVIDPCLNPDGRERYVNFYNSAKGEKPDANPSAREHFEPWPAGRTNHYFFDLNRDWAWQVQKETQGRVALYNQWLPQIHVDFHEQGYNAPYYFAPAAEPVHQDITPWQREFQVIIGKNNAKYFDQNGWAYFTKEIFDLLYPSYGDTYPLYNGSIGMTYEQGGIAAGLAVQTRTGDTLTLADRIAHHHSNSLSTIEAASANAQKALTEYKKYFDAGRTNPPGTYKTFVIQNSNNDKITALAALLKRNGIEYGYGLDRSVRGLNYVSGKVEDYKPAANDLVINAYQPKAVLLNVLLEPKTFIADSNTYDITGWALPYAYGLKAWAVKESYKPQRQSAPAVATPTYSSNPAYAYVSAWQSVNDVKFLAALLQKNIKVRYSEKPFEAGGKKFSAGSLLITRSGNKEKDFDKTIQAIAAETSHPLVQLNSGFVDKGADMGSDYIKYIRPLKVVLVAGNVTSSEAIGEVWHYFEQQINYPVTLVNYSDLSRMRWNDVDAMIFADGNYGGDFPTDKMQGWLSSGGKLIAMQNAVAQLADKKLFGIREKEAAADKKDDKSKVADKVIAYADRDKEALKSNVPGAVYRLHLDNTHPLGFGMPADYYTLKMNDEVYDYLDSGSGWNVGVLKKDGYTSGFVGQNSKAKLVDGMLIGVQSVGRGSVVFLADDPLFRSFWENGKLLFGNAVFMVQ
ncbi:M14 family metallopeptidase [Mucilaginibacter roseus]|uniref:M14 family metallopeptidase n=1 Tax=Mucilaginibacter roseus TaxID=1528868 RepID=A0ABS8U582_9SPHI|nr:M14 metallopeptidase family protein [Mucilaginibacter roseus]MCD8742270.1 M14 family metallopeptidase [Mucilaginibacter roseus]